MKFILIIILVFSSNVLAQNQPGQKIKAKQINNGLYMIGDIKHSLLSEEKFKMLAGDCWVKMRGQSSIILEDTSTQSISATDYGQIMTVSELPDSSGRFLRDIGGNASPLAETQNFAIPDISGAINIGIGNNSANLLASGGTGSFSTTLKSGDQLINSVYYPNPNYLDKIIFNPSSVTNVANEARPDNIAVNYFVKVNHICN